MKNFFRKIFRKIFLEILVSVSALTWQRVVAHALMTVDVANNYNKLEMRGKA